MGFVPQTAACHAKTLGAISSVMRDDLDPKIIETRVHERGLRNG